MSLHPAVPARSWAVLLMVGLALAACSKSDAEKATEDDQACQSYGANPGTDAYIQCRGTLRFSRLRKEESDEAVALAAAAFASSSSASSSRGGSSSVSSPRVGGRR